MTSSPKLITSLRPLRIARGFSQAELAKRVGLSRQALISIESGVSVPGTDVALRLSSVLGARVEALFQIESAPSLVEATLIADTDVPPGETARVVLSEIDGRWVAHPISARSRDALLRSADGLAQVARKGSKKVRVEPLGDLDGARHQLIVMGCAPALGLLAARLGGGPSGVRLSWIQGPSTSALDALRRGEVHAAGVHLLDEASGEYNVPFVRRLFRDRRMLLVNLASWEQGILVAPGNPLKLRDATDLLREKVRFVAREAGAGAHELLKRAFRSHHVRISDMKAPALTAMGHMEVAETISFDAADAGIAIRAAALAYGLDFIPLAQERFDLVIPRDRATDPRIERLVDTLGSQAFRRELEASGGYVTEDSGKQVGETASARAQASTKAREGGPP